MELTLNQYHERNHNQNLFDDEILSNFQKEQKINDSGSIQHYQNRNKKEKKRRTKQIKPTQIELCLVCAKWQGMNQLSLCIQCGKYYCHKKHYSHHLKSK